MANGQKCLSGKFRDCWLAFPGEDATNSAFVFPIHPSHMNCSAAGGGDVNKRRRTRLGMTINVHVVLDSFSSA